MDFNDLVRGSIIMEWSAQGELTRWVVLSCLVLVRVPNKNPRPGTPRIQKRTESEIHQLGSHACRHYGSAVRVL
jgi:hypothetical protein